MLELDQVVRQNQLACLPHGKSRKAEEELFSTYPELPALIEKNRRATLDSMALHSRLYDGVTHTDGSLRSGDVTGDKSGSIVPISKSHHSGLVSDQKNRLKGQSLNTKSSARNLMFKMDEEVSPVDELDEVMSPPMDRVDSLPSNEQQVSAIKIPGSHRGSAPNNNTALEERHMPVMLESPSLIDTSYHSSGFGGESYERRPSSSGGKTPWNYPTGSVKSDMRDIMAQASLDRSSNASSSLSLSGQAASGSLARLSQRERKKLQLQQQEHLLQRQKTSEIQQFIPGSPSPVTAPTSLVETTPISPWQMSSTPTKVSLQEVLRAESNSVSPSDQRKSSRAASSSPLTLRQTVPGNNSSSAQRNFSATGGSQNSLSTRSGLSRTHSVPPTSPQRSSTTHLPASISTSSNITIPAPATSIQSIRYQPSVAEPSLQLSMVDILALQQTEKDIIKEAAAKRSLQDIQEEQAFQEWWDQESRKVMENEEKAGRQQGAGAGRRGGGGGGGGSGRERGKARDVGKDGNSDANDNGGAGSSSGGGSGSRGKRRGGPHDDRGGRGGGGQAGLSGARGDAPSPSSSTNRGRGNQSRGRGGQDQGRGRGRGRGRGDRGVIPSEAK